ncbi:RIP metalloprotease RseP [Pelagerythrobacter marensis]|uniref:Zinc metalloprotease n=1 Tax=Pelagerythrobacter marensis TaxID=543877 RepID=A0A0G3X8V0_9SPHN|nr:RIP metalloprotease RseP [Pelagerythrobacter marensis]AKM06818.1 peptidase [Pelagerythrobacter marensis]
MADTPSFWMYVVGFLLVLGPLITIHEFGHYLVGRLFGVHAEAFSIGFGKEIAGWSDSRGTRWKLSALPLGGYVQFRGDMNPASVPDEDGLAAISDSDRAGAFHFKPLWQRALIVFAGPATNVLVALAIFAAFFMIVGKPEPVETDSQLTVAGFAEESAARSAGIEIGDRIVSIDDKPMLDFRDVQDAVMLYPGRTFDIVVDRGGRELDFDVTARSHEVEDNFGNASTIGLIGIAPAAVEFEFARQGPISALGLGVDHSINIARMMVTGVGQIVSGDRSVRELGGPIKIAKYSGEQFSLGPLAFINFIALISLNLAFINLLPIPALDGGHLAFYAVEAVRRKPVGRRGQELAFRTGMALVLALMVFVTINDLVSLPIFGS